LEVLLKTLIILSSFLALQAFAESEEAILTKLNYGGQVNKMRLHSFWEKETSSIVCFKQAKIDVGSLKGKNCSYKSSDSLDTAYYSCDEHETAISDCKSDKPRVEHVKKAVATLALKKVEEDEKKNTFECFQSAKVNPSVLKEDNCTLSRSVSKNSAYFTCAQYETAVTNCSEGQPTIMYQKKSLAELKLEKIRGYQEFNQCLKSVLFNDIKASECSDFGIAFTENKDLTVWANCGNHKVTISKCNPDSRNGIQPILSKSLISSKPHLKIVDSVRDFVKELNSPKGKEKASGASDQ
jgi:hypothetical protein